VVAQVAGLAESHRLLCMSRDARTLFFASKRGADWELGAVQLVNGGGYVTIASDYDADGSTDCVFADR
jgi:hypothetical protein